MKFATWIASGSLAALTLAALAWWAAQAGSGPAGTEDAPAAGGAQGGGAQAVSPSDLDELQRKIARFQSVTRPGPAHERLARLAGAWDVEVRYWLDPTGDPLVLQGECTNEVILGGRFLTSSSSYGEGPWKGESFYVFGHDARYGRYTLSAFDTAGTHSVQGTGSWNEATRTIHLPGTDWDPILGHTQVYSIDLRLVDEDEYVLDFTFYDSAHTGGAASKRIVEIVHRRRK